MKPSFEEIKEEFKQRNINLSYQRLKVYEYLTQNPCHPTIDQIFTDLQKNISTLSKTTVYNSLRILVESGLVRVLPSKIMKPDMTLRSKIMDTSNANPVEQSMIFALT